MAAEHQQAGRVVGQQLAQGVDRERFELPGEGRRVAVFAAGAVEARPPLAGVADDARAGVDDQPVARPAR